MNGGAGGVSSAVQRTAGAKNDPPPAWLEDGDGRSELLKGLPRPEFRGYSLLKKALANAPQTGQTSGGWPSQV